MDRVMKFILQGKVLDTTFKKTVSHEGVFYSVNCRSFLNGYTTKPELLWEEKK